MFFLPEKPLFCTFAPRKNKSVDKRNVLYIILLAITMAFAGCASEGADDVALSDSEYTEATAMSVHLAEPERALTIIDSAVIVGNLSTPRAEYLKAVTQYGGLDNMPLARQTCLDLLEHKEALTDTLTLEQTYILLASIEKSSCNYAAVIRYATEASRLAHASGRYHVVGKMEGYIAHAQALTGHTNEGIDRLQSVIEELRQMNNFDGVTSYHSASKNLLHILNDNSRFDEMVTVCEAMLSCYDELEQHPERFSIEREGFDPAEFVDFARGQTLAFLTIAYAEQGNIAKGLEAEEAVFRTRWSQSPDCDLMLVSAYHRLGQFDRFDQAMDRIDAEMIARGDTLNANYSQDGEGMITMAAGSGEKWAILLPQPQLTHPGTCSSDGVYIGTSDNVPEIYENGYLTEGISLTVNTPKGSLRSLFTVNANGDQVYFSQGNLQYIGSAATPYWKFADHQWDYLGTSTGQNSSNPNVDRDLFGYGTSGYYLGFAEYQPWTIVWNGDYWPYNLFDQTGQADWGYNAIANGGNTENSGWRTMTRQEGSYVFFTRSTASGIRFAKGKVNGVNGIILLPDNWDASIYTLSNTNYSGYSGFSNVITADDWTNILEANGAVFLPFAGRRVEASVQSGEGKYWSASSCGGSERYGWELGSSIATESGLYYCSGCSVRLVHNAE